MLFIFWTGDIFEFSESTESISWGLIPRCSIQIRPSNASHSFLAFESFATSLYVNSTGPRKNQWRKHIVI